VFWREVFTHGNGAAGRAWWVFAILWFGVIFTSLLVNGLSILFDAEFGMIVAFMSGYMSHVAGAMLMTSSVVEERKNGTLALVQFSNFSSLRLALGKILGTFWRTAPLWCMGAGMWFLCSIADKPGDFFWASLPVIPPIHSDFDFVLPFGGILTLVFWLALIHLSVICWSGAVALLLSNRKMVWLLNLAGAALLPAAALFVLLCGEYMIQRYDIPIRKQTFLQLVMPFTRDNWAGGHWVTHEVFVAIGGWLSLCVTGLTLATLRLRSRIIH